MRTASITRKTRETDILATINLDNTGECKIATGIGFLDHMLTALAVHGGFGLQLHCKGDLEVDCHHTTEDVGIVIGRAIKEALTTPSAKGAVAPFMRYGSARIPMDESIGWCDLDISGRPYLVFKAEFAHPKVGELDTQMIKEFFHAVSLNAKLTLHIGADGENDHHKIEAMFKAFAYAIKEAVRVNTEGKIISTKGVL
ncbi:MAG: imidazoleglycerol-phosphate dehydratase HisB [Oscillospiraceae bacterium]|nr:imidazoleglycerol-phosphate dehydratase HisB [Oscillospiraceae bacterium]